jgi:S-adenosylmethionine:tRNA ribosyltransferase-isomerase
MERLKQAGINFAYITLHVGAGTFKPVTAEDLDDHQIHQEQFSIDKENALIINNTKRQGARIIPVGTTSTRTIETLAAKSSQIKAATGSTGLFIKPGYKQAHKLKRPSAQQIYSLSPVINSKSQML